MRKCLLPNGIDLRISPGRSRKIVDNLGVEGDMTDQIPDTPDDFAYHQPHNPEEFKAFNEKAIARFRADGKVGGVLEGASLLLLTTTGARSGRTRLTPLAYFDIEERMIIVGSYGGADIHPAWVYNLRSDPRAHVELADDNYWVLANELPRDERDILYAKIVEAVPRFAAYEAATSRIIPLFDLVRVHE